MRFVFSLVLAVCSVSSFAVDFDDCQDRMHRLYRSARDADMIIDSRDDLSTAQSVIDEIQSRLNKARSACETGQSTASNLCINLHNYAATSSKQEALRSCRANFERLWPGFCSACLGQ